MDDDLLSIGQFARLGRLSVKQLRYYASVGLLTPARVDEYTGYRFYRREQARDALSIGLLRSLDVPLADIAKVLSNAPGALNELRQNLEVELDRRRSTLSVLSRLLADGAPTTPVTLLTEPERRVAMISQTAASSADIGRVTSSAIARLRTAADGAGPEIIGLFPLDLGEPVTITVALVSDESIEGAELAVLPGGRFASATHTGPYEQIGVTAHALLSWCVEHHRSIQGPIREVYVSDPTTTAPDRLITHLMIPVEEE